MRNAETGTSHDFYKSICFKLVTLTKQCNHVEWGNYIIPGEHAIYNFSIKAVSFVKDGAHT